MGAQPDYAAAWREFRKRRLIFWAIFLGYIPGVLIIWIAIGLPVSALTGIKPDYFFYPIALCWLFMFLIASLRVGLFRCPRCHKWFFATWWYHNPFARKCAHCGLPKWADSDSTP